LPIIQSLVINPLLGTLKL